MDYILQVIKTWYMLYHQEVVLGCLACIFILMILTLLAVRRCRKQIKRLTENTREMTKLALDQKSLAIQRDRAMDRQRTDPQQPGYAAVSPEKEELFGSVIQEIFP